MPRSGSRQCLMASSTWLLEHRPQRVGDLLARLGVQVHRVEHRAPDVVLHLVVGAVADPHRAGVVVPGQVVQLLFDEAALAADGVHHLQRVAFTVVGPRHVGDEREEVVGLAVEPERVQAPQRECRVAHPGVAVVPISFALRRFRQRRGRRRQQRSGRRVRQALQRQRAALQVGPPRVVREVADVDPLPPALAGLPHLVGGLVVGLRRGVLGPAQCDEHVVALGQPGPGPRLAALESDAQVGGQPQRRMRVRVLVRPRDRLAVRLGRVLPAGADRGGSRRTARSSSPTRRCRSRIARCAAGCARRPSPSGCAGGCASASRCRATVPSPACRGRSASRCGSARWSPGSGCPAGSGGPRAPRRRTARAGSGRHRGPGWRRTRWGSPGAARTAIPPTRPTRSGRCSRSPTEMRSRRSAGTGSAMTRWRHTAPGPSR